MTTTTLKILGITDERTECECCGRDGLKKTVALDKDGVVIYFGTECAAKATGRSVKDVEKAIRSAEKLAREEAVREQNRKHNTEMAAYDAWKLATYGDTTDSIDRYRRYRAAMA